MESFDEQIVKPMNWAMKVIKAVRLLCGDAPLQEKLESMRVVQQGRPTVLPPDESASVDASFSECLKQVEGEMQKLRTHVTSGMQTMMALASAFVAQLSNQKSFIPPHEVLNSDVYLAELKDLMDMTFSESLTSVQNAASDLGGQVLRHQAVFLSMCCRLSQATACLSHKIEVAPNREHKRISKDMAPLLITFRKNLAAVKGRHDAMAESEDFFGIVAAGEKHVLHQLDDVLKPKTLMEKLLQEGSGLHEQIANQTDQDCSNLADKIVSFCPAGWDFYKDTFL